MWAWNRRPATPKSRVNEKETERTFVRLRSQCPPNPDLQKHLIGYANLAGMK